MLSAIFLTLNTLNYYVYYVNYLSKGKDLALTTKRKLEILYKLSQNPKKLFKKIYYSDYFRKECKKRNIIPKQKNILIRKRKTWNYDDFINNLKSNFNKYIKPTLKPITPQQKFLEYISRYN